MLCCDDTVRENGSVSKAEKMLALCEEFDWVPISMKDDWTTIYGDGVTYLGALDSAAKASGRIDALAQEYIYQHIDSATAPAA